MTDSCHTYEYITGCNPQVPNILQRTATHCNIVQRELVLVKQTFANTHASAHTHTHTHTHTDPREHTHIPTWFLYTHIFTGHTHISTSHFRLIHTHFNIILRVVIPHLRTHTHQLDGCITYPEWWNEKSDIGLFPCIKYRALLMARRALFDGTQGGYRDLARLHGESCWQINEGPFVGKTCTEIEK